MTPSDQRTGYKLFIDMLYKYGIVKNRVFSFDLPNSTLSLGGFTLPDGFQSSMINWHPITNPYFWAVKLVDVHIGTTTETTAYIPLSTNVAVIDTSSSHLLVPN